MRRGRRESRATGLVVGAAIFGGLYFADWTAIPQPPPPPAATVEARPGDTPLKLLARVGVGPEDAQEAVRMLARVWNPRDLRPGQRAAVLTQSDRLLSFRLALAPDRDIVIARD